MRKINLFVLLLVMSNVILGQSVNRVNDNSRDFNYSFLQKPAKLHVKSLETFVQDTIGETIYDLQTNSSMQKRLVVWQDGTVSAVWTKGMLDDFSDRGTGYNHFNGQKWGAFPSARLENKRTGWPCIDKLGANGEIIVSHNGVDGLEILTRENKGTGDWTQTMLRGPKGANAMNWPRMITNGKDNNTVHLLSTSNPDSAYMGEKVALLYSRSTDGGKTWDVLGKFFPELDTVSLGFRGVEGDSYAWANPVGDTIAFVVGSGRTHGILMKSTDNGNTWTKTVFFQNPYPFFKKTILVKEPTYIIDGSVSAVLDSVGKAHIFFGIMGFKNDSADYQNKKDIYYFTYPYTDALGYWNEDKEALTDISPLNENADFIIARMPDINLDNQLNIIQSSSDSLLSVGNYNMSLTSMPSAAIDKNGNIYIVYSTVIEEINDGSQHYRRIFVNKSTDGGNTWLNYPTDLSPYEYYECVYPSAVMGEDGKLHVLYMIDEFPGTSLGDDNDNSDYNSMVYLSIDTADIGKLFVYNSIGENDVIANMNIYPNPTQKGKVNINYTSNISGTSEVELINMMGQIVKSTSMKIQGGNNNIIFDIQDVDSGIYMIKIKSGNYYKTQKLIVK